jgi:integrase/recombinase XerD
MIGLLHVHDVDDGSRHGDDPQGKGKRDRLIPIGDRALAWIRKYLDEVRPQLARWPTMTGVLFLTVTGRCVDPRSLGQMVRLHQAHRA